MAETKITTTTAFARSQFVRLNGYANRARALKRQSTDEIAAVRDQKQQLAFLIRECKARILQLQGGGPAALEALALAKERLEALEESSREASGQMAHLEKQRKELDDYFRPSEMLAKRLFDSLGMGETVLRDQLTSGESIVTIQNPYPTLPIDAA